MKVFLKLFAGVIASVWMCTALLAQTATTALRGSVADPSGAVIPGATVALKDLTSGREIVNTTDAKGEYGGARLLRGNRSSHSTSHALKLKVVAPTVGRCNNQLAETSRPSSQR